MDQIELAKKYTDETYLSKNEVRTAMRTNLVDGYWEEISLYRARNKTSLPFTGINKLPLFLTLTPANRAKISDCEAKLTRLSELLRKIDSQETKQKAIRSALSLILSPINKMEKCSMSDLSLKALLNGTYGEDNPLHQSVLSYKKALSHYFSAPTSATGEDFLADSYAVLLDEEGDLTKFYRTKDLDARVSRIKYMFNPIFPYAPSEQVEDLMGSFLEFLSSSEEEPLTNSFLAEYFLSYVQPFDEKNYPMAALFSKQIYLVGSDLTGEGYYLPFESFWSGDDERFLSYSSEAQQSGDLTYLLMYFLEKLTLAIANLSESVKSIKIDNFREEFSRLSPEEEAIAKNVISPEQGSEQMSLFADDGKTENAAPEASPAMDQSAVVPFIIREDPKADELPPAATKVEEKAPEEAAKTPDLPKIQDYLPKPTPKAVAETPKYARINSLPEGPLFMEKEDKLSEKEIKEYILYLRESNPRLSKAQAVFLAKHSTRGRYYTIQDFKSSARCAYETARTSMDKLVEEGYYQKEQLKNKFVYTPRKKGD